MTLREPDLPESKRIGTETAPSSVAGFECEEGYEGCSNPSFSLAVSHPFHSPLYYSTFLEFFS